MNDDPSPPSSSDSLSTPEEQHNLRLQIDALQIRLHSFEEALQSAIDAELQFRHEMTDALTSLHSSIAAQRSEDARLTDLVQQDTQRSREVMADYDNLASSFRENVQPPDPTRLRDACRTIGIVLSFIFMAPIQAVLWLLSQFFTRLSFGASLTSLTARFTTQSNSSANSTFPSAAARRNASTRSSGRQRRRASIASDNNVRANTDLPPSSRLGVPPSASHSPGTRTLPSSIVNDFTDLQANKSAGTNAATSVDSDGQVTSDTLQKVLGKEAQPLSSSSDVFVDARTGDAGWDSEHAEQRPHAEEEDFDTESSVDVDGRPAWALPLSSDNTLPDLGNFPSAEFWHISHDDMKLDFDTVSGTRDEGKVSK
ncbi:hypothetical protein BWQ96_10065 [Gracilariopsis chorda]|uniref:Uncharacterized protein n=1 Tax=Gracilariopsis chorda TaxID=448386 RepID=A0A2V3IDT6_9FLOR|nr:hypothetical protein BWQ96_10065 [Gracilariopsis chorda]|eukprot:PXF40227.1 hypothetical protein BWQ96_10065 [Gracilariopsis chorda]